MVVYHRTAKDALARWLMMLEDEGVDRREQEDWTEHPGWRQVIADAFGVGFTFGAHRVVFRQTPFVIKIDRGVGTANLQEWERWKKLSDQAKQHVFTPYCMTECGMVLVVELLDMWDYGPHGPQKQALEKQQANIFHECPEVRRIPDSEPIENWGLRGDKAVLLDCAGYC